MKKMIFLNENIFILKRIRRDETGMTLLFLILLIVLKYRLYKLESFSKLSLPVGTVDSIAEIAVELRRLQYETLCWVLDTLWNVDTKG